jgi:hypothetical protein
MKVLFYGGKSHGRHSMNVIAELLKKGHDVEVLRVTEKEINGVFKSNLSFFKGTNEILINRNSTLTIENDHAGKRNLNVTQLQEGQVFDEVKLQWKPDVPAIMGQILIYRQGKLFYEKNPLDDDYLIKRYSDQGIKKVLETIEKSRIKIDVDKVIDYISGLTSEIIVGDLKLGNLQKYSHTAFREMAKSLPHDPRISDIIKKGAIDLVYTTGLCFGDSFDDALLRAAHQSNIHTVYEIFSWDNLTTKASILTEPDAYFVWNARQVFELRTFHEVQNKVLIAGASRFENLDQKVLYDNAKKNQSLTVLYVGSSPLGNANDFEMFKKLVAISKSKLEQNIVFIYRIHKDLERIWGKSRIEMEQLSTDFLIQESSIAFIDAIYSADLIFAVNTSGIFEVALHNKRVYRPSFVTGPESYSNYHHEYVDNLCVNVATSDKFIQILSMHLEIHQMGSNVYPYLLDFISPHGTRRRPSEFIVDFIEELQEDD